MKTFVAFLGFVYLLYRLKNSKINFDGKTVDCLGTVLFRDYTWDNIIHLDYSNAWNKSNKWDRFITETTPKHGTFLINGTVLITETNQMHEICLQGCTIRAVSIIDNDSQQFAYVK